MAQDTSPPANVPGTNRRFRVGGSRFTYFTWENNLIGFARQVSVVSPAPVGPGPVPIQPLTHRRPIEIITPAAVSMGEITLDLYELYGFKVWEELINLTGERDLAAIFKAVADKPNNIQLVKVVKPPLGSGLGPYSERFNRCVITNVEDGEVIEVGTMEVMKRITIGYTSTNRNGGWGQRIIDTAEADNAGNEDRPNTGTDPSVP